MDALAVREIEGMIHHPGWGNLVEVLRGRQAYLVRLIVLPQSVRPAGLSDDFLRGELQALRMIIDKPIDLLEAFQQDLTRDPVEKSDREATVLAFGMTRAGFPTGAARQPDSDEEE